MESGNAGYRISANVILQAYLKEFLAFCYKLDGGTSALMRNILYFEADRRAINITMNSSGIDLSPDSRCLVLSKYGTLYTRGQFELAQFEVPERIRAAMRKDPTFCSMSTSLIVYSEDFIERILCEQEMKFCDTTFQEQFNYATFYGCLKRREQEIRNIVWVAECISQGQKHKVNDGIVLNM